MEARIRLQNVTGLVRRCRGQAIGSGLYDGYRVPCFRRCSARTDQCRSAPGTIRSNWWFVLEAQHDSRLFPFL